MVTIKGGPLNFYLSPARDGKAFHFSTTDREEKHMLSGFIVPEEARQIRDALTAWLETIDAKEMIAAELDLERARPCGTCGKPGHLPMQHGGWDPRDEGHG